MPAPPEVSRLSNDAQQLGEKYIAVQESREFGELRRTFRRFVFPVTAFFLAWYFVYVLLSIFAPGFMGTRIVGTINIGLIFGLGQFVTTFAITILYARWADRQLDPQADAVVALIERDPDIEAAPTVDDEAKGGTA